MQVASIGEAMISLYPDPPGALSEATTFGSDVGGAEFNVASSLARMSVPTAWISRVGADPLGARILAEARACGVDVTAVQTDPTRPTGLYLKDPAATGATMHYYRAGSAASAMTADALATGPASTAVLSARVVHTTGITAALSAATADVTGRLRFLVGANARVSVDLNYRPALWAGRSADALTALVGQAHLLFAGHDEAEAHFGHSDPQRLLESFPLFDELVLKDGPHSVTLHARDSEPVTVTALSVDVVEAVGAGDAFAAGYLAGLTEGRDAQARLRIGHACAASALITAGDRPRTLPTAAQRDVIAGASEPTWRGWAVAPGQLPWAQ